MVRRIYATDKTKITSITIFSWNNIFVYISAEREIYGFT
jgi:hypothetical protein